MSLGSTPIQRSGEARGTVEVALVLDNSGSMAGTYITDLRTAAANLVDVVFTGFEGTEKIKVGVVPFAGAVNVGPANANASWMDSTGLSPAHFENFDAPKTRFELLQQMGATWGGCVEVRPSPHDVTDSVPNEKTPASLFVPMFNPDEPDSANDNGDSYGNNYLPDYGGTCPAPPSTCTAYKKDGVTCKTWSQPPVLSPKDAQARVCKYPGASITSGAGGPNYLCDSVPIMPLTSDKAAVKSLIGSLQAKGGTNVLEGVMWGWRVLSPEAPFTEGKAYNDPDNDKFLIVMTDGENWHQAEIQPQQVELSLLRLRIERPPRHQLYHHRPGQADDHQDAGGLPERKGRGHQGLHRCLSPREQFADPDHAGELRVGRHRNLRCQRRQHAHPGIRINRSRNRQVAGGGLKAAACPQLGARPAVQLRTALAARAAVLPAETAARYSDYMFPGALQPEALRVRPRAQKVRVTC